MYWVVFFLKVGRNKIQHDQCNSGNSSQNDTVTMAKPQFCSKIYRKASIAGKKTKRLALCLSTCQPYWNRVRDPFRQTQHAHKPALPQPFIAGPVMSSVTIGRQWIFENKNSRCPPAARLLTSDCRSFHQYRACRRMDDHWPWAG